MLKYILAVVSVVLSVHSNALGKQRILSPEVSAEIEYYNDKEKLPAVVLPALYGKRLPDGSGAVSISGELKQWHNVVLTLDGPYAHELDNKPNPFVDRHMNVLFTHVSGNPKYLVPGYFAADGNAGESSARSGTKWRAHLSPDKTGQWSYRIVFQGSAFDGKSGSFTVGASDKNGCDLRAKGRLIYVGKRYLRFAGSGEWFLKVGADAPETLLAYADFDDTEATKPGKCPLKNWSAHIRDWHPDDPSWKNGKGRGLIGAVNYLSSKGCNAFSFIPYNAGGDGDNVWPHVSRSDKRHFDCSRLDQWGMVFNHSTARGMYLHFKLQETENDDLKGKGAKHALDGGELGVERKAYLREMIARFGHNLALNWNIGEENTQSHQQIDDMIRFIRETDPYGHNVVLHTYPNQQDKVYNPFLGKKDRLIGLSIQNSDVANSHRDALKWVTRSEAAGHPWIVALDEAGNAGSGTPPDPDWPGMKKAVQKSHKKLKIPSIDDVRAEVLWGTLMAGGAGVEYYFGYRFPENDLTCENWRSRDKTWDYSRYAINFFRDEKIPFWEMKNSNALIGNTENNNSGYCLAKAGKVYLVYLRKTGDVNIDLTGVSGTFKVQWFDPRNGGSLVDGTVGHLKGGTKVSFGKPPADLDKDWLAVMRMQ